jgi:hypothetical protein
MPLIFVMQHGQRVLELKLLILNLFSHIILKRAHFWLSNIKLRTLIERKSRVPQLQGVQGRSCPAWAGPRALGNAEDGVASAFPKGKQNEKIFLKVIALQEKTY